MMESIAKILNTYKMLTIIVKVFIKGVWQGPKYVCVYLWRKKKYQKITINYTH